MSRLEIRLGDRTLLADLTDDCVRIEDTSFTIVPIAPGIYRVSDGAMQWAVAVAGPSDNRWVFVDGQITQVDIAPPSLIPPSLARHSGELRRGRPRGHDLSAPMPATVVRVLVEPGSRVGRGDTLVVLEAMKMELAVRAPRDGVVRNVHCKPGELVQPGVNLVDLE